MRAKRITVIFYAVAFGIAVGYWAGQENAQAAAAQQTAVAAK